VIAFLRLIHNPADEVSLDRVINVPPRGIGDKTVLTLHTVAHQKDISPGDLLLDLARGSDSPYWASFPGRSIISLADFGASLANWRSAAPSLSVSELFDRIVNDLGYKDYINDDSEEGVDRWENVHELHRLAVEYDSRTLDEFLENVALVSDQDTLVDNINAPTLLTLHAAKGLEFGAVFLIGLDDGYCHHNRSFDDLKEWIERRSRRHHGAKDRCISCVPLAGHYSRDLSFPVFVYPPSAGAMEAAPGIPKLHSLSPLSQRAIQKTQPSYEGISQPLGR
jgi:DNA helicase-2/ATP-dependent DNA helicase PcrA